MKIAVIGWGSLIWDQQDLQLESEWYIGGPVLPVEFSRISKTRNGALTLVIDTKNGSNVPTKYAFCSQTNLVKAIDHLRVREGTTKKNIGYVNLSTSETNSKSEKIKEIILNWGITNNIDAVIWTDLSSNFQEITNTEFSIDTATNYLHNLNEKGAKNAREYIRKTPKDVFTPLREKIHDDSWFNFLPVDKYKEIKTLSITDPGKTLDLLRQYEAQFPYDINLILLSAGIFIDIGHDLNKLDLIEKGIFRLEIAVEKFELQTPEIFFNLGNGYLSINDYLKYSQGDEYLFNPDKTPLIQAKDNYRKALSQLDQCEVPSRVEFWVNYGNCLAALGRTVEALFAYDQALLNESNHPLALGNLAIELHYFAKITTHSVFDFDAHEYLVKVLSDENNKERIGEVVWNHFTVLRNELEATISDKNITRPKRPMNDSREKPFDYIEQYKSFCTDQQLFLNLCHSCQLCEYFSSDTIMYSLITKIKDDSTFTRLSRVVNEIKENYTFSRFLLFQALFPNVDSLSLDELTRYVDNLDYAIIGTRVASIKTAYITAYNILDKVAHFLNSYLNLGIEQPQKITFNINGAIWKTNKNKSLRPEIIEMNNPHLFALYDIACDLNVNNKNHQDDGFYGYLRRIRNSLTHEYLIIHVESIHLGIEVDHESLHVMFHDFVDNTLELLRLIRSVIIYLVAFIDYEERKKKSNSSEFIVPIDVHIYDPGLYSHCFKEINLDI